MAQSEEQIKAILSQLYTQDDQLDFAGDDFRVFSYKVIPCSKTVGHDWTACPFAHANEKAARRCPVAYNYTAIACPDMKQAGDCPRAETCLFAHNVFEYWLHPHRYRTQLCSYGTHCRRGVCFFAHRPSELRIVEKSAELLALEAQLGATDSAFGLPGNAGSTAAARSPTGAAAAAAAAAAGAAARRAGPTPTSPSASPAPLSPALGSPGAAGAARATQQLLQQQQQQALQLQYQAQQVAVAQQVAAGMGMMPVDPCAMSALEAARQRMAYQGNSAPLPSASDNASSLHLAIQQLLGHPGGTSQQLPMPQNVFSLSASQHQQPLLWSPQPSSSSPPQLHAASLLSRSASPAPSDCAPAPPTAIQAQLLQLQHQQLLAAAQAEQARQMHSDATQQHLWQQQQQLQLQINEALSRQQHNTNGNHRGHMPPSRHHSASQSPLVGSPRSGYATAPTTPDSVLATMQLMSELVSPRPAQSTFRGLLAPALAAADAGRKFNRQTSQPQMKMSHEFSALPQSPLSPSPRVSKLSLTPRPHISLYGGLSPAEMSPSGAARSDHCFSSPLPAPSYHHYRAAGTSPHCSSISSELSASLLLPDDLEDGLLSAVEGTCFYLPADGLLLSDDGPANCRGGGGGGNGGSSDVDSMMRSLNLVVDATMMSDGGGCGGLLGGVHGHGHSSRLSSFSAKSPLGWA